MSKMSNVFLRGTLTALSCLSILTVSSFAAPPSEMIPPAESADSVALPLPPTASAEEKVTTEEVRLSDLLRSGATMEEVANARSVFPVKNATEAIRLLKVGNARFFSGNSRRSGLSAQERRSQILGQSPFAVLLGCSDSRVPTEIIFDQTLGDLFAVRVAGNISEPATVASVQYAIAHLKAKLIVVMGHEGCGAVKAAMSGATEIAHEPKPVQDLLGHIVPAVTHIGTIRDRKSREREAVIANVRLQVYALKQDPLLKESLAKGQVGIIGAFYEITSGIVDFFETEEDLRIEPQVAKAAGLPIPSAHQEAMVPMRSDTVAKLP